MGALLGQSTGTIQPLSDARRMLWLTTPYIQGKEIKTVQRKLGITADGIYGPDTKAAVKQFQAKNGLAVDGIVGPNTWAALDTVAASPGRQDEKLISTTADNGFIDSIKSIPHGIRFGYNRFWKPLPTSQKLMYGAGGLALLVGIGLALSKSSGR